MRSLQKWTLAGVALAVWSLSVLAAEKEEMVPHRGAVRLMLLRQKSVQDELKVTPDEAKKIDAFASQQWKKAQTIHELPAKEHEEKGEELSKENDKFIHETLMPDQLKRLNQIGMQLAGLLWVTRPEVATEIKLTDEQKAKAHELLATAHKEMQEILRSSKGGVTDEHVKTERRVNRQRLMGLLTDEQKAKWKELAGPRFEGKIEFGPSK
jgi:hypothetical protein